MWSGLAERKPWATVVLALLLSSAVAMFYLGRARAGVIYLFIQFLFAPLALIGIPHSYIVAKRQGGKRPTAWHGKLYGLILITLIAAITLNEGFRAFLWRGFQSPSTNMLPTIAVGDHYYVSKFAYGYSRFSFPLEISWFEGRLFPREPERGDIVVFRGPHDIGENYIKRIVGLPGDRIQMKAGILHINGVPVKRERIEGYEIRPGRMVPQYLETLPNGRAHRIIEDSGDIGRGDTTREFTVPDGYYFAMGDNRDNSLDSRVVGPIPGDYLIGRVSVVFWNGRDWRLMWFTPE